MEDAHTTMLSFEGKKDTSFFAVYDGHGGSRFLSLISLCTKTPQLGSSAARFAGRTTHFRVVNDPEFEKKNYPAALKNGFLGTDIDLRKGTHCPLPRTSFSLFFFFFLLITIDPGHNREPSGCTAVAVLITDDNHVFCANAGDSRSIMSSKGVAVPLSYDHKPSNQSTTPGQ